MGIVHHSNYIRWMEEARTDVLEQIGLPYDKIEKAGILIPVLGASCEYRISFRYAENFRIKVIPNGFNGIKMGLKYEIYGQEDGKLHAAGGNQPLLSGSENDACAFKTRLSGDL